MNDKMRSMENFMETYTRLSTGKTGAANAFNKLRCLFFIFLVISSVSTASIAAFVQNAAPKPINKPLPSIHEALAGISSKNIRSHLQNLEGVRNFSTHPDQLKQAQTYIETTFSNLGYVITQHSFISAGSAFQNVIATRLGTRYPERRVLVIAHFDTVATSPGADDNASGVAVMLDLAKRLQAYSFENTIQFIAANQEEDNMAGSRALANFAKENAWQIKGVICLDQVGYAGDAVKQLAPAGLEKIVPAIGNFIAAIGNEASTELVGQFIAGIRQQQIPLPHAQLVVPGNGEQNPDTGRSDHSSFWDAGYPAILVTDTAVYRNPHSHTHSDEIDTLNIEFLVNVCRAVGELVNAIAVSVEQH